jgi:uncharacterized membrane protein
LSTHFCRVRCAKTLNHPPSSAARTALNRAAAIWLSVALLGQWLFAYYIASFYAGALAVGAPELINRKPIISGYIADDVSGNAILFAHVLPAIWLSAAGVLQLLPWIRARFPAAHRWNGRVFLLLAIAGACTGLYLTWVRGSRLSDIGAIGISFNGVLIVPAAVLAWYYARRKNWAVHQKWAIRTFILVSGVWTFRLGLMAWYVLNQGPRGNTEQLDGPFDLVWSFACYLFPLMLAELYFWAREHATNRGQWAVVICLGLATLLMVLGIAAAFQMLWRPYL